MSARRTVAVELSLESETAEPEDVIRGRVAPVEGIWAIDLVRVESSPAATLEFTAATVPAGHDGTFSLPVPADAPPSVAGTACALTWRVRARTQDWPLPTDARRTVEISCPS